MRVKLEQGWVEHLLRLPESGMGYQHVDVRFADGREVKNLIVLNAEEMELPDEYAHATIEDIKLHAGGSNPRQ
jgi:hypothetical protein